MKRILLAAAALLSLDVAAARAQTITLLGPSNYETYSAVPFFGGLCAPAYIGEPSPPSNACPNAATFSTLITPGHPTHNPPIPPVYGPNSLYTGAGPITSNGLIDLTIPAPPSGQYWLIGIGIQGNPNYTGTGDVWVPVLKSPANSTIALYPDPTNDSLDGYGPAIPGYPLTPPGPTTEVVPFGTYGTGLLDGDITAAGNYTLAISDLLATFAGALDTLPGELGYPGLNSSSPPDVASPQIGLFSLTVTLTPAPEPASLVLLGVAASLLGAVRLRRRGQRPGSTAVA